MEIREKRLYRADGWDTFEEYCQERWGWTRMRSQQLIDSAKVISALSDGVNHGLQPLPATERQARALAPLRHEPEAMRAVWTNVREEHGEHTTAANIREMVRRYKEEEEPPSAEVVRKIGPMGPIPATERQARELAPLRHEPETMREIVLMGDSGWGRPFAFTRSRHPRLQ